METNIKFPHDFYEKLYNEIMDYSFDPENEDDTECSMEIEIGKFTINLTASFEVNVVDNSFDHAFGTEYIYDLEAGDLTDIEIEDIWYYDDETDLEAELTEQFDEKRFWEQFKQYAIKREGIFIRYGDEVVVKHSTNRGAWERMTFLYYDTRLRVAVCTRNIRSKYIWKKQYKCILPATTGALSIVGKTNYYLSSRV